MRLKNSVCHKFHRQINDEIAAGQQFDYLKVKSLKEHVITPKAKALLGVPSNVPFTLYDLAKGSIDVLGKLRFIYLLSLLEAFGKELIAERERIGLGEISQRISDHQSRWQKDRSGPLSSSSFSNLAYLRFLLHEMYGIDFSSVTQQWFWEAGILRNCVVHYRSIIPNEEMRNALEATIETLGVPNVVGTSLYIADKVVWGYIDAARNFISACDV